MDSERAGSIRIETLHRVYREGLRSVNLGTQPAPWVVSGLKRLEEGKDLSEQYLETAEKMGGTDHNDPWFT